MNGFVPLAQNLSAGSEDAQDFELIGEAVQ